jgi:hypothetical protein
VTLTVYVWFDDGFGRYSGSSLNIINIIIIIIP